MTYHELPERAGGAFLYCPECHSHSSATRGDYFACDPSQTIVCGHRVARDYVHCQTPLVLAREERRIVRVAS